jgi:hypothetical protein
MIERRMGQPFQVMKRVETVPDAGGSGRVAFVKQETVFGVVSRVGTAEGELANSNVLTREKNIRTFSEINVAYNDKIFFENEEWSIVGEPETIRSLSNRKKNSTLIRIRKEGKD